MMDVIPSHRTIVEKRLPSWFRQELPDRERSQELRVFLRSRNLNTVCESARCPNSGKCWNAGVVTVMILGNSCMRHCRFCAVSKNAPQEVDPQEPQRVAELVRKLNVRYAVVTSVTRDDLADGGAGHFAQTVRAIRAQVPRTKIELLIPDFRGIEANLKQVIDAGPDVVGHNIEMARRLFPRVRPQADYDTSLDVLRVLKRLTLSAEIPGFKARDGGVLLRGGNQAPRPLGQGVPHPSGVVKSGFMVGLGETDDEVRVLFADLAGAGCEIVTVGQYLAPSKMHAAVERFVTPERFLRYREWGEEAGIPVVVSGPLVRSSYLAGEGFVRLKQRY